MKLKESEDEDDLEEETDESEDAEAEEGETVVETDNVGDASVEINVEELIHELEVQGVAARQASEHAARRRLEELMEKRRSERELEDFDDYEI